MAELTVLRGDRLDDELIDEVTRILADRVRSGAALGWTAPPSRSEIVALLQQLCAETPVDACAVTALEGGRVVGFGYWRRYERPTHRKHADLEKVAVASHAAGRGIGRALLTELIDRARAAGVQQLTLDFRGDNTAAESLYRSLGFEEYGRLRDFVSPGDGTTHDKVMHVLRLTSS